MTEPLVDCKKLCEATPDAIGKSLVGMREKPCCGMTADSFKPTGGLTGMGTGLGGRKGIWAGGGTKGTTSQRSSSDTRQATYFLPSSGTRLDMTTENHPSPPAVFNSLSSTLTWRTCVSRLNSSSEGRMDRTSAESALTVSTCNPCGGASSLTTAAGRASARATFFWMVHSVSSKSSRAIQGTLSFQAAGGLLFHKTSFGSSLRSQGSVRLKMAT